MSGGLVAGTVLGDRFEIHGALGRGGTATVYLATDRLRSARVALKVVHPHLAADPSTRRRLQREIQAASMLRTETALVPHDLHELDGHLALSMPYHAGRTLTDRVADEGALTHEEVRSVGVRIATALAEAHRMGVLHRDVSANNVLVGASPDDTVLTDFGLSRVGTSQRSTGLLGTAGYAAPEVYSGDRGDPRSDLYGLGAALYLAAAGRPAFEPTDAMAALRHQMDGTFPPLSQVRPDLPTDLALTIERLLAPSPEDRPHGAREVVDLLERREAAPAAAVTRGRALPEGNHTVLVRERDEDRARRDDLRAREGRGRRTAESEIARWGRHLVGKIRDQLGVPDERPVPPEDQLRRAVAEEAGLAIEDVQPSPMLLHRRFRLIELTDGPTATRLANAADAAGFRADAVALDTPNGWLDLLARYYWTLLVGGWLVAVFDPLSDGRLFVAVLDPLGDSSLSITTMIVLSVLLPMLANAYRRRRPALERYPIAYTRDLAGTLVDPTSVRAATSPSVRASRSETLLHAALRAIDSLEATVGELEDRLPDPACADLRSTARELRERANELAAEVGRLDSDVARAGAPEAEITILRARLDRLDTLARAGESSNGAERGRLAAAVAQHEADLAAADRLEARLATCTARLLEIASTASRVRRELLDAPSPGQSADDAVARLRQEAKAAAAARTEVGRQAARAQRERS